MRATICSEDFVVEVFDAKAQTRHADCFECFEFRFLNRAGLTLERYFFSVLPTDVSIQTTDEIPQLLLTDVRRCAAAEVCEAKLASLKPRAAAVELVLFDQRIEVDLDLRRVLVCVDFEVAEQAALPAKRNVKVQTQRIVDARRLIERVDSFCHKLGLPLRERRIVRDKIISYFSSGLGDICRHKTSQVSINVCSEQFSVQPLCSLCLCGDLIARTNTTTETQRTQRLHKDEDITCWSETRLRNR